MASATSPGPSGQAAHTVLLVRHGRTALNAAGRLRGRLDPPLDSAGREQVLLLATALEPSRATRVLSSPLRRAQETAQSIANRLGIVPDVDPRLVDRDYGEWAGLPASYVVMRWGSLDAAPGVEPERHVVDRARAVLEEPSLHRASGPVIVVAHDAINRALLASLDPSLGPASEIPQDCACWNVLTRYGARWQVTALNRTAVPAPVVDLRPN
jgi:probable phosphoglycerate mutase